MTEKDINLKRILAATDFSFLGDAAVHRAAVLAAREDSELLIVHALPRASVLDKIFVADVALPARMRAVARDRLAALVDAAAQAGVRRVRAEAPEGPARRTLANVAKGFHPDLLVIGAHGKGPLQQFFLGGTASRILTRAVCPVLVTRGEPVRDYCQALAAVDLRARSEAVLHAAIIVAAKARVTVVHAYQAPFEARLRYKGFSAEEIARYSEPEAQAAQRNVSALLADPELVGLDLKIRTVHGHPNPLLFDIANELGADLMVVGKHGGSRLEESMVGGITRLLAYDAPCDVLVA
ncbi:MAG: universal stress protein [Candidatus Accumulibacter sp. UW26]|jgi:nucleotide-binding universal stress UspA family protein